jgi:hypothetical protein
MNPRLSLDTTLAWKALCLFIERAIDTEKKEAKTTLKYKNKGRRE